MQSGVLRNFVLFPLCITVARETMLLPSKPSRGGKLTTIEMLYGCRFALTSAVPLLLLIVDAPFCLDEVSIVASASCGSAPSPRQKHLGSAHRLRSARCESMIRCILSVSATTNARSERSRRRRRDRSSNTPSVCAWQHRLVLELLHAQRTEAIA